MVRVFSILAEFRSFFGTVQTAVVTQKSLSISVYPSIVNNCGILKISSLSLCQSLSPGGTPN